MNSLNKEQKQKYQKYIKEVTPTHSLPLEMGKAFLTGGLICVLGQFLINTGLSMGLEEEAAGTWCSILLVLLSVLLTGFNLYPSIAKWGGAGALVPITGFANGVASAAIEYKKEGQVFGIVRELQCPQTLSYRRHYAVTDSGRNLKHRRSDGSVPFSF